MCVFFVKHVKLFCETAIVLCVCHLDSLAHYFLCILLQEQAIRAILVLFGELALLSKLWERLSHLGLQQVSGIICPFVVEKPLPCLMLPISSVSLTWGLAVGSELDWHPFSVLTGDSGFPQPWISPSTASVSWSS